MDTRHDLSFGLQMQNESVNVDDEIIFQYVDLTNPTSNSTTIIDLTGIKNKDRTQKRSTVSMTSQKIKRLCNQNEGVNESIVDHSWEILDPNPDIYGLFVAFNKQYFWSTLNSVVIQWSKRMTLCAGLCKYESGSCSISLSEPLLKLRPRKDLVETLLHEMIHAYLFLTNNRDHKNRDGHGTEFCKHMFRINKEAGTKISIYHSFHEEVKLYKQHWWKCNGPCQHSKPFYGYVKRSINRAPGPYDNWWANHQAVCGGNFIKVKEPEGYKLKKKSAALPISKLPVKSQNKITNFIEILDSSKKNTTVECAKVINNNQKEFNSEDETTFCPVCNETVLKDWLNSHLQNCSQLKEIFGNDEDNCRCPACNDVIDRSLMNEHLDNCKLLNNIFKDDSVIFLDDANLVNCPNCDNKVLESNINLHLDICISVELPKPCDKKIEVLCPCCENKFNNAVELDEHIDNCLQKC